MSTAATEENLEELNISCVGVFVCVCEHNVQMNGLGVKYLIFG